MAKPKKLVLDSSVLVKWVNSQEEQYLKQSDALLEDCKKGAVVFFVPELAKYEVGNALWKKGLSQPQAKAALAAIYAAPVSFIKQDEDEAARAMDIAIETRMTFYDATFVALAERLGAALVTDNPKHQSKIKHVKVISLKNYS